MLAEERRDLPSVDRFPWQLAQRVVTTRQPDNVEIDTVALHFVNNLPRHVHRKSKIIARGDETDRSWFHFEQARDERRWANRQPTLAQLVEQQFTLNAGAHMLRRD